MNDPLTMKEAYGYGIKLSWPKISVSTKHLGRIRWGNLSGFGKKLNKWALQTPDGMLLAAQDRANIKLFKWLDSRDGKRSYVVITVALAITIATAGQGAGYAAALLSATTVSRRLRLNSEKRDVEMTSLNDLPKNLGLNFLWSLAAPFAGLWV